MSKTLYQILEVAPSASAPTIEAAYNSLMSRYHPDHYPELSSDMRALAFEKAIAIERAYRVLRDAEHRASYDEDLRRRSQAGLPAQIPPQVSSSRSEHDRRNAPGWMRRFLAAAVGIVALVSAAGALGYFSEAVFYLLHFLNHPTGKMPSFSDFSTAIEHPLDGTWGLLTFFGAWVLITVDYWISFHSYRFAAYLARGINPAFSGSALVGVFVFLGILILFFPEFGEPEGRSISVAHRLYSIADMAVSILAVYTAYSGRDHFWKETKKHEKAA